MAANLIKRARKTKIENYICKLSILIIRGEVNKSSRNRNRNMTENEAESKSSAEGPQLPFEIDIGNVLKTMSTVKSQISDHGKLQFF